MKSFCEETKHSAKEIRMRIKKELILFFLVFSLFLAPFVMAASNDQKDAEAINKRIKKIEAIFNKIEKGVTTEKEIFEWFGHPDVIRERNIKVMAILEKGAGWQGDEYKDVLKLYNQPKGTNYSVFKDPFEAKIIYSDTAANDLWGFSCKEDNDSCYPLTKPSQETVIYRYNFTTSYSGNLGAEWTEVVILVTINKDTGIVEECGKYQLYGCS
jgi:hypothetical protein